MEYDQVFEELQKQLLTHVLLLRLNKMYYVSL